MTKLDANLSKKSEKECETENLQSVQEIGGKPVENRETLGVPKGTPNILVGEMNLAGQTGAKNHSHLSGRISSLENFTWIHLRRISISQIVLSMIACLVLVAFMVIGGTDRYKSSQLIMALFLLITGQSGLKASAKSYKHLIIYTIMSSLQWMINVLVLGCLIYSIYDDPLYATITPYGMTVVFAAHDISILVLILQIIGSLAMFGTIITGVMGLNFCCKKFGELISEMESFLMQKQCAVQTA